MKKKNDGKYTLQFLHVIMIQSNFKYLFATSVKKYRHLFKTGQNISPLVAMAFIPLLVGKLDIKS